MAAWDLTDSEDATWCRFWSISNMEHWKCQNVFVHDIFPSVLFNPPRPTHLNTHIYSRSKWSKWSNCSNLHETCFEMITERKQLQLFWWKNMVRVRLKVSPKRSRSKVPGTSSRHYWCGFTIVKIHMKTCKTDQNRVMQKFISRSNDVNSLRCLVTHHHD